MENTHQTDTTFWERVVFTDNCKFNIFAKKNTALQAQNVLLTVKHGGGSVMVYGTMAASGVAILRFIDKIMDQRMYLDNLKDSYIPGIPSKNSNCPVSLFFLVDAI